MTEDDVLALRMLQKSFSELKKQVRTAEEVRLISKLFDNVPMKFHRRGGAPWAVWASLLPF